MLGCGFWKPFILTLVVSVLLGLAVGFVLGWFDIMDIVISLIGFIVGLVLFHIFLHGGSWGFILTPKQITLLTEDKE
jgi:ribose/xylose/arabinose/galactoside ABC-type transport system permease subunit